MLNCYADLTFEEKNEQVLHLQFSFDLEREKTISDVIKIIRGIGILELEPEKIERIEKNDDIELNEIKHYTELIVYSSEKKTIIFPQQTLDNYVNKEDKIFIDVYEVLNSLGLHELYKNDDNFKLYSFISTK